MLIGYARVSTSDQTLTLQSDALKAAGCEKVFKDEGVSGSKSDRTGLNEALEFARKGDTLVVWRLDRLGRSFSHLIEVVNGLADRGVEFRSLNEIIDISTAGGKLAFHLMAAMAEFEGDLIRERTNAGLAAARARGRQGGRPSVLSDSQVTMGRSLAANPDLTVAQICEQLGCSRATYYRQVARVTRSHAISERSA